MPAPAVDLIRHHGRATATRARVLEALLAAPRALSHAEIEARLAGDAQLDRVTLYRVLDWLVSKGLAHRVSGEDRVRRFNAVDEEGPGHAHFHCSRCCRVFCLDDTQPTGSYRVPPGFRAHKVELNILGLCPACASKR